MDAGEEPQRMPLRRVAFIVPCMNPSIMHPEFRDNFVRLWKRYFPSAELPIVFYLAEGDGTVERATPPRDWRCIVCDLARVRRGKSLAFDESSIACPGARYYMGYTRERRPEFRYFLSCGIPGVVEGERYKRSPEIVDEMDRKAEYLSAEGRHYIFKRWDLLAENEDPEVIIFFAGPEEISGLFTLANFDQSDPNGGVIAPFGSGCSSVIHYPLLEQRKERPRAILGMFDPSARPCVPLNILTFAVPMGKFMQMIECMEESFLITATWERMRRRIERSQRIGQTTTR